MADGQRLYKGRIIELRLEEVTLPNGVTARLEIVRHPGAAAIVPLHDNGDVTLIRQYRHAAGGFIWEIPAGVLHPGEEPSACAARELREETGLLASEIVALGTYLPSPGFCDERIHLFLARGLTEVDQQLDHDEVLSVARKPLTEALAMIRAGEIQDGKSIAALHHVRAGGF
jgi:ADP-ribose pyrophosphatase